MLRGELSAFLWLIFQAILSILLSYSSKNLFSLSHVTKNYAVSKMSVFSLKKTTFDCFRRVEVYLTFFVFDYSEQFLFGLEMYY